MTNGVLQATDVVKSYNKKEVLHQIMRSDISLYISTVRKQHLH